MGNHTDDPNPDLLVVRFFYYFIFFMIVISVRTLRQNYRRARRIPPNDIEDCCAACFCGTCTLAQLARETMEYDVHDPGCDICYDPPAGLPTDDLESRMVGQGGYAPPATQTAIPVATVEAVHQPGDKKDMGR
jgi:hypothetical protein